MDAANYDANQVRALVALVDAQSEQLGTLREAVDSLEAKVAIRSELDMIVSQELRLPLEILQESLDELRKMQPGDSDFPDVSERALRNVTYLQNTVDELLRPWRGEGPVVDRKKLEMVDLDTALERVLGSLAPEHRERISISGVDGVSLRTSAPRLNGILVNVIEHSLANSSGYIDIHGSHNEDGTIRLQVVEYAPSKVDPNRAETITKNLADEDMHNPQEIGLFLVRMLARSLGGDLALEPGDNGSLITIIQLPQRRIADGDPEPQA